MGYMKKISEKICLLALLALLLSGLLFIPALTAYGSGGDGIDEDMRMNLINTAESLSQAIVELGQEEIDAYKESGDAFTVSAMEAWEGSQLNEAKDILAYELTNLVHGEEEAGKAKEASKGLFGGSGSIENMPKAVLTGDDFRDGKIDLIGMLTASGLAASRSEGRRAIEQGGVSVNDEKVTDVKAVYDMNFFDNDGIILKKGKKSFKRLVLK